MRTCARETELQDICNHPQGLECTIENIADALSILSKLQKDSRRDPEDRQFADHRTAQNFPFGIWFRGEPVCDHPLTPSIFRPRDGVYFRERGMIWDAGRRIPECSELNTHFEQLCMAQHYLIPTRLLDWTENILTALYFAVSDKMEGDKKLYLLNAFALNKATGWKEGKSGIYESVDYGTIFRSLMAFSSSPKQWRALINRNYPEWDWNYHEEVTISDDVFDDVSLFQSPIAVVPTWTNPRMVAQSSVFTLHGGSLSWETEESFDPEPMPKEEDGKNILLEFIIPEENIKVIKNELLLLGIHQGSIYPEIDKQREYF